MTRYVLIGMGVAAIAAAEAIRSLDRNGWITLISKDRFGYYSRPGLAYYLSGEVNEKQLFPYQPEDYKRLNANFQQGQVTRVFPVEKLVEFIPTARIPYDYLLIATGSQSAELKIAGVNLAGVHKLDHLDDAHHLIANAKQGRTAVVTGGGITALELVEGLSARRVNVHYVLRNERYWPNVLDPGESRIIEDRLRKEGITLHYQREISEIVGKNGKVIGVKLTNGEQIRCDLLAYAIGITPSIRLAQEAGVRCERGILVDEYMQTNLPDIFAAGDVAQVYDFTVGKYILDSLWPVARQQGHVAGLNMARNKIAYIKPVSFNVTRLAGLTTTIIGRVGQGRDDDLVSIARGDSETWRQMPNTIIAQCGFDVNHLRLVIGDTHILGAIVMGDQKLSGALQTIVTQKIDISAIRDALLAPNAPIADILADFWLTTQSLIHATPSSYATLI